MPRSCGLLCALALLAGCATISANPIADVLGHGVVLNDLLAASYNLDEAVVVGALDANDPAPACLHDVLAELGVGPDGASTLKSFAPKRAGLVSEGALLYIRARQVNSLASHEAPLNCKAFVGQVLIDAAKAAVPIRP